MSAVFAFTTKTVRILEMMQRDSIWEWTYFYHFKMRSTTSLFYKSNREQFATSYKNFQENQQVINLLSKHQTSLWWKWKLCGTFLNFCNIFCLASVGRKKSLAPVVQRADSGIQRINLYPLDSAIGFPKIYPLENAMQLWNNWGLDYKLNPVSCKPVT